MPLLETLMIDVGGSIAKALLTRWLSDNTIVSDASASLVDILKGNINDRLAQRRARQQFETIGEKVGESLMPIFEKEGALLDEGSRNAIALAVANTLNSTTPTMLAQNDLEPSEIAQELLTIHPARSYHFSDTEGRLYEQIVSECCQYIVEIASQLPHFTERTFSEILVRERHLIEVAERILQDIARLRAQLNPQSEAGDFEMAYRRAIIRKLDEVELFGSGMSVTARKYSLSLAYVALSLEHEVLQSIPEEHENLMAMGNRKDRTQLVRTVDDFASVLAESPYLLLRGDAGSGKTTLMHWIAVQCAAQACPDVLAAWNDAIPFFIRLRQHVRADQDSEPQWPAPESFPGLVAPAIGGAMPAGWVHRQLQNGRALVLVDGIDEVPAPLRPGVYEWLGDLVMTYPQARFIVTARPYAASKEHLPVRDRLKEAQVLPMTPTAIKEFIQQWHRAVAANIQDPQEKQELQENADQLVAEINAKSDHTLQHLATSPLLCSMLCALNRERHQQLPTNRVALYEACCELLIERRDRERRISLADYPAAALSYEQKSLLLSHLAYWLIRNGQTEGTVETVDERLGHRLARIVGTPPNLRGSDARQLFIERSGILREPIKGAIDFTHRTFQEFLAAKAVVDEDDINFLAEHAHNDQWREVVLLTVGLAPRGMRERLVERLLKRAETRKRPRARLYLLAAACTQVAREEMKPETLKRIEHGLVELVPLKSVEEVHAMAQAGTLAIPYLAPRFEYDALVAANCVRTLLQIGTKEALDVLEDYITDETSTVQKELILGLRGASDKQAYAQRFLPNIQTIRVSPPMIKLLPFLPHVTSLDLSGLPLRTDLSFLERLPALTSLELSYLPQISNLSFLERLPALTSLELSNPPEAANPSVLQHLSTVTPFDVSQLSDLSFLKRLPALSSLSLYNLPHLSDLSILEHFSSLSSLQLSYLPRISDLSILERLPTLSSLALTCLLQLSDLSILERLPTLSSLELVDLPKITDLSFIEHLPNLSTLGLHKVADLSFLKRLPALSSLGLYDVSDLSILERFPALTSLSLFNISHISDLSVLERLPALSSLELYRLPDVSDLSVLERLPALSSLELYDLPNVSDLSFLERLHNLKTITLKTITIGDVASGCVVSQDVLKRVRITRL